MKIAVIGTVGVPASYGGFETLVECLIESDEVDFTVYCSSKHYTNQLRKYKGAKLVYLKLHANGAMSILYDILSITHGLLTGHRQFLILGVSGAIIIPIARFFFPSVRTITNIDGIEWRREKWRGFAKWMLRFSEALAVKYSTIVVADNSAIGEYIKEYYNRDCQIIAYGGDHALVSPLGGRSASTFEFDGHFALGLCRIEPENNVHLILDAFSQSDNKIIFIGNWDSSDYGKKLKSDFSGFPNIKLLNPIYDNTSLYDYRSKCCVYIHGHSAGGTNPSLVEMMHFSKPIIAYDCSYNRATLEGNGMYFSSVSSLSRLVVDCDSLVDDGRLLEVAQRRYTWDLVRGKYISLFKNNSV